MPQIDMVLFQLKALDLNLEKQQLLMLPPSNRSIPLAFVEFDAVVVGDGFAAVDGGKFVDVAGC